MVDARLMEELIFTVELILERGHQRRSLLSEVA
jgi:hypothetical protein